MHLIVVGRNFIDAAWRDGAHQLGEACHRSAGEVTADQLRMRLARGELLLLAIREGAELPVAWLAVNFEQHPNLRTLFIYAIHAPGAVTEETLELVEQYARENGASRLRGAFDEPSTRLWKRNGFTEAYTIMEKDLWAAATATRS